LAQRWHQRELFLPEIICYQKYSFCSYWYRDNYFIFNFGKYLWIPYDKDGCGYYYFIWLLSSSNVIQKNKTKSRTINDSEDLCIYVDYCNGTTDFVGTLKMRWKTAKYRMWL